MHREEEATITGTPARVSPAEYARLRGLNRSTIGRQVRAGKIPIGPDGLVDISSADAARAENLDTHKQRPAGTDFSSIVSAHAGAAEIVKDRVQWGAGVLRLATGLRGEDQLGALAALAADVAGCTPAAARKISIGAIYLINSWAHGVLADQAPELADFFEKDLAKWAAALALEEGGQ